MSAALTVVGNGLGRRGRIHRHRQQPRWLAAERAHRGAEQSRGQAFLRRRDACRSFRDRMAPSPGASRYHACVLGSVTPSASCAAPDLRWRTWVFYALGREAVSEAARQIYRAVQAAGASRRRPSGSYAVLALEARQPALEEPADLVEHRLHLVKRCMNSITGASSPVYGRSSGCQ